MKATKLILWAIILVCFPIVVAAQNKKPQTCTVTGQIVDEETGKPVPYATVGAALKPMIQTILHTAIADEEGRFECTIGEGNYLIHFSSIGYKSTSRSCDVTGGKNESVSLGQIKMLATTQHLAEVIVKPLVDVSSSEIVYNLSQDPDRETMNLHEILDKVPMVERTPDGRLYVDNPDTPFLIVRNGREDALFGNKEMIDQTLKALPAKAFQKITLKLMPESRYGDYKYVLSIDADEVNRLYGVVNQNYDTYNANNGELRLTSSIMTSFDRLRMNAGGDFRNVNSPETEQTLTQTFHYDGSALAQDARTHRNGESFGGSAMASYDLGTQHFVTARIAYSNTRNRNYEDLTVNNITPEGTSAYASWTKNRNTGYSLNGYVNYQYDFAKPNRVLNIRVQLRAQPRQAGQRHALHGRLRPDHRPALAAGTLAQRAAHRAGPLQRPALQGIHARNRNGIHLPRLPHHQPIRRQ